MIPKLVRDKIKCYGDMSHIRGDMSGISGNVSAISGNVDGVSGNVSGISGNLDMCELTEKDRCDGIDITRLIQ